MNNVTGKLNSSNRRVEEKQLGLRTEVFGASRRCYLDDSVSGKRTASVFRVTEFGSEEAIT